MYGYPRNFHYIRPRELNELLKTLKELGSEARVIAGGQSLLPLMKLRLVNINHLVDIYGINELRYIHIDDYLRLGPLLTHNDIAMNTTVRKHAPILSKAAWGIADLQVRNRGTLGGSLAHADPAANYYPALLVLDAEITLKNTTGSRTIKITDFIKGPYTTDTRSDEIITEIKIPPRHKWRLSYDYFKGGGSAYPSAIASAALLIEDKVIIESRISLGAIYPKPTLTINDIAGLGITEALNNVKEISSKIIKSINETPLEDTHTSGKQRLRIAETLLSRVIKEALKNTEYNIPTKDRITTWNYPEPQLINNQVKIKVKINNNTIESLTEPRTLLIDFLRNNGFKEVKKGCDEGKCGACTVLLDGTSVKSCLILAVQTDGHEITTIRGLGTSKIQEAFLNEYAMQCGYCTHGFMMVTHDYINNIDPQAKEETIKQCIKNICRCGSYPGIIRAIRKLKK